MQRVELMGFYENSGIIKDSIVRTIKKHGMSNILMSAFPSAVVSHFSDDGKESLMPYIKIVSAELLPALRILSVFRRENIHQSMCIIAGDVYAHIFANDFGKNCVCLNDKTHFLWDPCADFMELMVNISVYLQEPASINFIEIWDGRMVKIEPISEKGDLDSPQFGTSKQNLEKCVRNLLKESKAFCCETQQRVHHGDLIVLRKVSISE
ncbi:MAG: hypothetical protein WC819_00065 [Parcubacteria group bacterium]|jgi:hypothetical protein